MELCTLKPVRCVPAFFLYDRRLMKNMYKYFQRTTVFVLLAAVHVSFSFSQTASLSGQVVDAATHQPVTQAVVEVLEIGTRKTTDDEGRFRYEQVSPGRYTISVRHIAYASIEYTIVLSPGKNDSIITNLRPALFKSGEVVVRSTRTMSAMNNTPYPIDIEMNERLTQSSPVTVSDALRKVPGIALVRDGTWETAVSIRGMSRSNIVSLIDDTRIETANDISGALSLVNINDLERVETLKSSGSVLYGTGALGGILQLVTKRPTFTDQNQVKAEWTSSASGVDGGLSHFASLQSSSDHYALRVSGGFRNAGNTTTPDGVLPNSQYHDFSLTGSLGIKTVDEQSLFLSYQRSQANNTGIPGGSAFGATAAVWYTLARRELFAFEYNIPNISSTLPFITFRMSHQEIDRNVEILQNPVLTVTPHAVHDATSAQLESKIIPMTDHLLVLGTEAWERALDSRREKNNSSTHKIIGERPIPLSRFFSAGIYAQDEWTMVPNQVTVTLGARYDWIHVNNDKTFNPEYTIVSGIRTNSTADSTILWNSGSAHDESWSANAGIQYAVSSHLDLTFLAATAFRSPSLEERYQFLDLGNGIVQVGNPNLQPERSLCLNIGNRIHTEGFNIQMDFFLNHMANLVSTVPGTFEGRPATINTNIGEARLYGYEISGEGELTSWSVLKASLAYVRGQDMHNHGDLPQIAPLNGQVEWSGYVRQVGTVSISCSGDDSQNNLASGEIHTAGYAIVDINIVSVPWNIGQFVLTLHSGIQNVLDKAYQNHLSTLRGLVKEEPGRNYFLSLTVAV
jgi:hemoglobin/transferrin/lactoferrin receptor protein